MKRKNGYWFVLEPYVYSRLLDNKILLYNTLDGNIIEKESQDIKMLLQEMLNKENGGIAFISEDQYNSKDINEFIFEIRNNYMGDIIKIDLSQGKPIQIMPYINYLDRRHLKGGFLKVDNILQLLFEITIYVNQNSNLKFLISFLNSLPKNLCINFEFEKSIKIFNEKDIIKLFENDLSYNIIFRYEDLYVLNYNFRDNISFRVSINFPLKKQILDDTIKILKKKKIYCNFIFYVSSNFDIEQCCWIIDKYQLEEYSFHPVYTGDNINFFRDYVFMSKKDIFSDVISLKDIYKNQLLNRCNFGKLIIMTNGDVYANKHYPKLGNIYINSLYWLIRKEINEGKSWLRIRDMEPCNKCIYQWICPSPSNYELEIGKPNLCNIM